MKELEEKSPAKSYSPWRNAAGQDIELQTRQAAFSHTNTKHTLPKKPLFLYISLSFILRANHVYSLSSTRASDSPPARRSMALTSTPPMEIKASTIAWKPQRALHCYSHTVPNTPETWVVWQRFSVIKQELLRAATNATGMAAAGRTTPAAGRNPTTRLEREMYLCSQGCTHTGSDPSCWGRCRCSCMAGMHTRWCRSHSCSPGSPAHRSSCTHPPGRGRWLHSGRAQRRTRQCSRCSWPRWNQAGRRRSSPQDSQHMSRCFGRGG